MLARAAVSRRYVGRANPCRDLSDGVKVGWIGDARIGLTAGIVGAIVTTSAGPHLGVDAAPPPRLSPTPPPAVATVPLLRPAGVASGAGAIGVEAGLIGAIRL